MTRDGPISSVSFGYGKERVDKNRLDRDEVNEFLVGSFKNLYLLPFWCVFRSHSR